MEILLFGDQTANQYSILRTAVLRKDNFIITAFVDQVGSTLREETRNLPYCQRQKIPDFLHLTDLIEAYRPSEAPVAGLESALVTICQLAYYIGYFEDHPDALPDTTTVRCVSLCTGSIAAAAVLSARSLSELVSLALEAVRIAFRIGTCVGVARDALVHDIHPLESWSTIVADTHEPAANSALNDFHDIRRIHRSAQAYISATTNTTVTISGPPTTTKSIFKESKTFKTKTRVPISVYAPYHAAHLYGNEDIQTILNDKTRLVLQKYQPRGSMYSAATGERLQATGTLELFEQLVHEILCQPVRWNHILEELVLEIKSLGYKQCKLFEIGSTNVVDSVVSALKVGGQVDVHLHESSSWLGSKPSKSSRTQNEKIAIVGMAGRFPNAADHEKLWDLLMRGLDVHRVIPEDRFNAEAHYDQSGKAKNKSHTPYGCFIDEPGLFDNRFFNMSPREAAQTDPMGRLALVTAYEALEMSGFVPNRTPSTKLHRVGTFYGQTSDDWREINAAEEIDTYFITGGVRAFAPGRINYYFKFEGPSFSIDTACSSSLAAIHIACTSLWAGDCDTACAGGLNVLTNPDIFAGLSKGQFLSKTGSCKTFDNSADGYCRGDGCGTVILKRYQDAIDDRDNILGCILNCGTNHSANAVSITHPHADAQEFLFRKILADIGVDAHEVSYVEMHGTGTQVGDGIEMTSVTNVFSPTHRRRRPSQPLYLGSIKPNIGHGEAASGINSMIKCLLMLREGRIPPNVGIKQLINQAFPKDLAERNVHIPLKLIEFPRNGTTKRRIFINNFSAAGGNTSILLEDGPERTEPLATDPRSYHIITVTARAIPSLKNNITNLANYLDNHPSVTLPSLSYTLNARRIQHNYRIAFSVSNISEVRPNLLRHIDHNHKPTAIPTGTVFVFTGQGIQYARLAYTLYEKLGTFRNEIEKLDKIAQRQELPSFLPLITALDVSSLSPVVVQLGLACIQVALAHIWSSWSQKPVAVIGHSLGEYAALHIAGVISATDMVRLVGHRACFLVTECTQGTHGMLAVKGNVEAITNTLGVNMLEVACKNGPEETVLCGSIEMLNIANKTLREGGFKATVLEVPFAFHSAQVEPILQPFRRIAESVIFKKPNIPIMSPLLGKAILEDQIIGPDYLVHHARRTVDFQTAVLSGLAENIFSEKTAWLEIGPHPVCSNMVRNIVDHVPVMACSFRRAEDAWKTISTSICTLYRAGIDINFNEYHRNFNDAHELLILPTYSFDNKTYWLTYHNNWCLTKGKNLTMAEGSAPTIDRPSKLSTTSCQRITHEEIYKNSGTLTVLSDITEPKLFATICGHMVNGAALCPSSLYADMALTVSNYLFKKLRPKSPPPGLNVCNMEVHKPLIAQVPPATGGQYIQVEAVADVETGEARIKFQSATSAGIIILEHGQCTVKFEDISSWIPNWSAINLLAQSRIEILKHRLQAGTAHKILRGMAYKLFQSLVSYNEKYRGMEEILLDGNDFEATALVSLMTSKQDGNFFCSPYWLDSLCHISGFVMNGTDLVDSTEKVFISLGWETMRFARPISAQKTYRSYVRMEPQPKNLRAGDVCIFDGDELIGVVGRVTFQQISRRVLNTFLPPAGFGERNLSRLPNGQPASVVPALAEPIRKAIPLNSIKESPSLISRIMDVIARETGFDITELTDEVAFVNLGVDSLMSLSISADLRERLDLEISSTLFSDCLTVGDLKRFFGEYEMDTSYLADHPCLSPGPSIDAFIRGEGDAGQISLSASNVAADEKINGDLKGLLCTGRMEAGNNPDPVLNSSIQGVPSEKGLGLTELITDLSLGDNNLREASQRKQPVVHDHLLMSPRPLVDILSSSRPKSMLLQGNPKTATKILFLFPDGSGSATSYVHIPNISSSVVVYGFNCPFMKNPRDLKIELYDVCTLYIAEMQRHQPSGPYFIGGWSAGGVIAYEVAVQLSTSGQKIDKLFLIDSPCPVALAPLPRSLFSFFDRIGLLGSGGKGSSPDWLVPHFEATVRMLAKYKPAPLLGAVPLDTILIWAKDGVCGRSGQQNRPLIQGEEPRTMKWLLDDRTDFGDNGWAQLLCVSTMKFHSMEGNHFTMMTNEHASTLGRLIKRGLGIDS